VTEKQQVIQPIKDHLWDNAQRGSSVRQVKPSREPGGVSWPVTGGCRHRMTSDTAEAINHPARVITTRTARNSPASPRNPNFASIQGI
jgi:hypothetical protein